MDYCCFARQSCRALASTFPHISLCGLRGRQPSVSHSYSTESLLLFLPLPATLSSPGGVTNTQLRCPQPQLSHPQITHTSTLLLLPLFPHLWERGQGQNTLQEFKFSKEKFTALYFKSLTINPAWTQRHAKLQRLPAHTGTCYMLSQKQKSCNIHNPLSSS